MKVNIFKMKKINKKYKILIKFDKIFLKNIIFIFRFRYYIFKLNIDRLSFLFNSKIENNSYMNYIYNKNTKILKNFIYQQVDYNKEPCRIKVLGGGSEAKI